MAPGHSDPDGWPPTSRPVRPGTVKVLQDSCRNVRDCEVPGSTLYLMRTRQRRCRLGGALVAMHPRPAHTSLAQLTPLLAPYGLASWRHLAQIQHRRRELGPPQRSGACANGSRHSPVDPVDRSLAPVVDVQRLDAVGMHGHAQTGRGGRVILVEVVRHPVRKSQAVGPAGGCRPPTGPPQTPG